MDETAAAIVRQSRRHWKFSWMAACALELLLNEAVKRERSTPLGAEPYARDSKRVGYANGFKPKQVTSRVAWVFVPAVEAAPLRLSLRQPFPNPSRAGVRFRAGHAASFRVRVFDVRGREVARILNESRPAGWSDVRWDGSTGWRGRAPTEVYFVALEGNNEVVRRKFVLAR